jgi:hypothetical protein
VETNAGVATRGRWQFASVDGGPAVAQCVGMPSLVPLSQWYCDACAELIAEPADGILETSEDADGKLGGFRICHRRCCPDSGCPLARMLGSGGMSTMLAMLGHHGLGHRVRDLGEWTLAFRRLHRPLYEEARSRLAEAAVRADERAVANELSTYRQRILLEVVEKYGPPVGGVQADLPMEA